jgi:hypothetical protein
MGAELLIARGPPHDQKTAATALALGMSGPLVSAVHIKRAISMVYQTLLVSRTPGFGPSQCNGIIDKFKYKSASLNN